jgi:magnesium transporter
MFENELELIENKQYALLRRALKDMNPADLAQLFEKIPQAKLPIVFRILPKELAAETFVIMEPEEQELLIHSFSDTELREVLDEMFMDDTVDVIEEMPAGVVKRILRNCDAQTRRTVNAIIQYPEDSAGSIMTTEFMDLKSDMTVADAFLRIRRTGFDKETIYTCYVTDSNRKLIGLVTVLTLLLGDPERLIGDIMEKNVICVRTHDDQEAVVMQFDKYDLLALPVVDAEERLVGIVTVDDAIDVMQEEVQEDFEKMAAMHPTEENYFRMPAWKHARNRIMWLLFLMLSATFTGLLLTYYEDAFAAIPLLVSFIPMLMGTGGNCGSQSATMIIRGLAIGR